MTINSSFFGFCVPISFLGWSSKLTVLILGKFKRKFGRLGSQEGELNNPSHIAMDKDGRFIISDSGNHRVQIFKPSGDCLRIIDASFVGVAGVEVDFNGSILIADSRRIQSTDPWGDYITDVVGPLIQFQPCGITCDIYGRIIVADLASSKVKVFSKEGEFLMDIGDKGQVQDQGGLHRPSAAVMNNGNLIVVDSWNHRIQIFS